MDAAASLCMLAGDLLSSTVLAFVTVPFVGFSLLHARGDSASCSRSQHCLSPLEQVPVQFEQSPSQAARSTERPSCLLRISHLELIRRGRICRAH
eukprot:6205159-Pleurochrysis_carterae.AAC.3